MHPAERTKQQPISFTRLNARLNSVNGDLVLIRKKRKCPDLPNLVIQPKKRRAWHHDNRTLTMWCLFGRLSPAILAKGEVPVVGATPGGLNYRLRDSCR